MPDSGAALVGRDKILLSIPADWDGRAFVDVIADAAGLDRSAAETLILRGGAWLDRRRVQEPAELVAEGQVLGIHFPPRSYPRASITAGDILYEDTALLVLNKAPGYFVNMPPWDAAGDVLWAVRQFLLARDGSFPTLHLAHQLDRDTSGVLVISKEARANAPLQEAFLSQAIRKRYLALIGGRVEWEHAELRTGHGRGASGLFRIYPLEMVGTIPEGGRLAIKQMETHFDVVERFGDATLLEARPLTGRTHQIRLHLAHLGHPVAGDLRYAGPAELAGIALWHHLLHAAALQLPHPIIRRRMTVEAPLPPLFVEVLDRLRAAG